MTTLESITELRRRTALSSRDAVHALSVSHAGCDAQREADGASATRRATKSLYVFDSNFAARLAAGLIGTGVWFECEQLDREKWYFAVAPAGHARLLDLHEALRVPQVSRECAVLRSLASPEAGGRIHS